MARFVGFQIWQCQKCRKYTRGGFSAACRHCGASASWLSGSHAFDRVDFGALITLARNLAIAGALWRVSTPSDFGDLFCDGAGCSFGQPHRCRIGKAGA